MWLDARGGQGFSFVSHAHADHVAGHGRALASARTAWLLKKRFRFEGEITALEFHEPWEHAGHRIVLLPAGHVPGSAMIHLTRLSDGATLLYTGDFKLRESLTGEPTRPLPANTVIMECTFGRPHYVFPPLEDVRRAIHAWCRNALDHGETPVLLGYSLGKAQEIQALLGGEFPVAAHESVAAMNEACAALGMSLPPWEVFTGDPAGKVLVFPPTAARSTRLRRIKNKVTAMVSGWALNPGAKFQYQVDEVFPLSDHADYPALLELVELTKPRHVLTTHGFAQEFARDLRALGWNAWTLAGMDQLEFDLPSAAEEVEISPESLKPKELIVELLGDGSAFPVPRKGPGRPRKGPPPLPKLKNPRRKPEEEKTSAPEPDPEPPPPSADSFDLFCAACDAAAAAAGRLLKIRLLAEYFRALPDGESLAAAARFLAGQAAETREQSRELQTGWAILRMALLEATGHTMQRAKELSRAQNDAGRVAFLLLEGRTRPEPWTLAEVRELFDRLRAARGPLRKSAVLTEAFRALSANAGQYVVKILTGDTRIGLKEGLLEEALAEAFDRPADEVREAHTLCGDIGETARRARDGTLAETTLRPFQPVRVMLASPEPDSASIWARLGGGGSVWAEDKFDGVRAQLHFAGGRAALYSRDLRSLDREFPDLLARAAELRNGVILDGEIIAFAEGRKLDFFDLQKRLGRREADLFMPEEVPLKFYVFDLLWLDGRPLLKEPLRERRRLLEALRLPPDFERVSVVFPTGAEELEAAFHAAKARGNEGLIVKDPESPYAAGRRGKTWLKLKQSSLRLDVVVVKVEQGHGKRGHVLSDYTFAVRDGDTGELKTIGKAYSGLTDAEIEELTEHFKAHTLREEGRARVVTPNVVLEVAFDSIRPGKRHESGLSLRFPRIIAVRRDKTPEEIDTLEEAWRLARLAGG